jgi:hypothetical protein
VYTHSVRTPATLLIDREEIRSGEAKTGGKALFKALGAVRDPLSGARARERRWGTHPDELLTDGAGNSRDRNAGPVGRLPSPDHHGAGAGPARGGGPRHRGATAEGGTRPGYIYTQGFGG